MFGLNLVRRLLLGRPNDREAFATFLTNSGMSASDFWLVSSTERRNHELGELSIAADLADRHRSVNPAGLQWRYVLGVVRDLDANAFCGLQGGVHVIGLTEGFIHCAWEASRLLLKNQWVFPRIGTVEQFTPEASQFSAPWSFGWLSAIQSRMSPGATIDLGQMVFDKNDAYARFVHIECPYRNELALKLCRLIIDIAALHELAHARRGHMSYLRSGPQWFGLFESAEDHAATPWSPLRRYLESEADSSAISDLAQLVFDGYCFRDSTVELTPRGRMQMVLLAFTATMHILWARKGFGRHVDPDYPHPLARLIVACGLAEIGRRNHLPEMPTLIDADFGELNMIFNEMIYGADAQQLAAAYRELISNSIDEYNRLVEGLGPHIAALRRHQYDAPKAATRRKVRR